MGMPSALHETTPCLLRQRMLGSEAVYQVIGEDDGIVTAEVVSAPGLEPGMRVRMLARAAYAMERLDPAVEPAAPARRFDPLLGTAG